MGRLNVLDLQIQIRRLPKPVIASIAGYAIGGVSVGEPEHEMMQAVELTEPFLPARQARYAMGLGTPAQLVELVARGVDMFDCVLPTRVARNGTAFTPQGTISIKGGAVNADFGPIEQGCSCFACQNFSRAYVRHLLNLRNAVHARDDGPIDRDCPCPTCVRWSRGYLRHLLSVGEPTAWRLLSIHNSHHYLQLMRDIRAHLAAGTFAEFRRQFAAAYVPSQKILSSRVKQTLKEEDRG